MKWLTLSCSAAGLLGLAGLLLLGPATTALVLPLAGLAALPLLGPYLRRGACGVCRTPADPSLGFCPGCAS